MDNTKTQYNLLLATLLSFGLIHLNAQNSLDINNDGELNILILGSTKSIQGGGAFTPYTIAEQLNNLISGDTAINLETHIVAEDIYQSKPVLFGLGGGGTEYTWNHHSHSLVQYYYWPDGFDDRHENLKGNGAHDWDYVIIGSDPYFPSTIPGFYALGVNKIASKVMEGGAKPLLLMTWPRLANSSDIEHFESVTYRVGDKAKTALETIPAGLVWNALPNSKKDVTSSHPSPNGAFVCAASIYSHLTNQNSKDSDYKYDDEIADITQSILTEAKVEVHYQGIHNYLSPYSPCNISDQTINYNHTGTSSERGILQGLNWVFGQSPKSLQKDGTPPINFNYGRANTNFEPNKRYKINPELFDYSFGFPMQDHGNHGNTSMLYGIDKRDGGTVNDTDVGVARYMVDQNELPYGRAVPVRSLYAQMEETMPGHPAYRDSWHMHRNLDKSIAGFMYTILNGTCVLSEEPMDNNSEEWRIWMSHKIGFETAWTFMYLEGSIPECSTLVDDDGDGFSTYTDCDDSNALINPDQVEVIYNGIDEDCDPNTPDDDIDQDGYGLTEDCDDNNDQINPGQQEIPYNSLDDDCNPLTPDDDLDMDGYGMAEDCDDTNPLSNPGLPEIPYNDIDDDCDPLTLDDDLDMDGFGIEEDCDDSNPDINPDAEEIPNNGIDEDCDGSDMTSSVSNVKANMIKIYPNPAGNEVFIEGEFSLNSVKIYDILGRLRTSLNPVSTRVRINISDYETGLYLIKVENSENHYSKTYKIYKE